MKPHLALEFIVQRYEAFNLQPPTKPYTTDGKLYVAPHLILVTVDVDPIGGYVEFRFKLYYVSTVVTFSVNELDCPQRLDERLFHVIRQLVLAQIKFPPIGEVNPHGT